MSDPTIAHERTPHGRLIITRDDGSTVELADIEHGGFVANMPVELGDVRDVGVNERGVDGVARSLSFVVRNDAWMPYWSADLEQDAEHEIGDAEDEIGDAEDGAEVLINLIFGTHHLRARESFSPLDTNSYWNIHKGEYKPLLWHTNSVKAQLAVPDRGESPDWITVFDGQMGDAIRVIENGAAVECEVRDGAKRLQDAIIEETTQYGSEGGTAAETVIQNIINDWVDDPPTLHVPESPGFMVRDTDASQFEFVSVWDAIQQVAAMFGWFLGYRRDPNDNEMKLTLLEPPRDKASPDWTLTAQDDVYPETTVDISDESVRNRIIVRYIDKDTGEHQTVIREDAASIAKFGKRPAQFAENETSLIDNQTEAENFADAALADLKDLSGFATLTIPLLPELDLFDGVSLDHVRLSSLVDFYGVESLRHEVDWAARTFRTEALCGGKVIGAHHRWLRMQARPGLRARPLEHSQLSSGRSLPKPSPSIEGIKGGVAITVPKPQIFPEWRWAKTLVWTSNTSPVDTSGDPTAEDRATLFEITKGLGSGVDIYAVAAYEDTSGNRSPLSDEVNGTSGLVQTADIGDRQVTESHVASASAEDGTDSSTFTDIADSKVNFTLSVETLCLISFSADAEVVANAPSTPEDLRGEWRLVLDGSKIAGTLRAIQVDDRVTINGSVSILVVTALASGSHTIKAQQRVVDGWQVFTQERELSVAELKR